MPCYNQGKYLHNALQSVFDQTYSHWQCIIVNDGATDNTEQIAQYWVEKDARFKYIYQANQGLSSARNTGLQNIKGDYVQFLDADDIIDKEKFTLSLQHVPGHDIIVTNYRLFLAKKEDSTAPNLILSESQLNLNSIVFEWDEKFVIPIHCALIKAALFNDIRFNENLKAKEDWVMWIELFKQKVNTSFIDLPLAFYRHTGFNMSHQGSFMNRNLVTAFQLIYTIIPTEYREAFFNKAVRMLGNQLLEIENTNVKIKQSKSYRLGNFLINPLKKLF